MRNRPTPFKTAEQKFIESAYADTPAEDFVKEDLHKYVKRENWPLEGQDPSPSLAEGSNLKKPMLLYLNEKEWNSIDRHVKTLGVSKQEWIRHAVYRLLEEEQTHFLKSNNG